MANERGRPRGFAHEEALDRALQVFWRHGFQGASLADLTEAMGLSKPSLYAAFGDKESLYLLALERYVSLTIAGRLEAMHVEPDARAAVRGFLRGMAGLFSDAARPGGCFVVNGVSDLGGTTVPAAVDGALRGAHADIEAQLRKRLARAREEGQLAGEVDVPSFASFLAALLSGLGVMAKCGAKSAKLERAVDSALQAWSAPASPPARRTARPAGR